MSRTAGMLSSTLMGMIAISLLGVSGCGDDDEGSSGTDTATTPDADSSTTTDSAVTTQEDSATTTQDDSSATSGPETVDPADSGESDADTESDGEGPIFTECDQACIDGHPSGFPLLAEWFGCQEEACAEFERGSQEYDDCTYLSWAPESPDATCRAETSRCFSSTATGCRELMDLGAATCEPETLPMDDAALSVAMICLVQVGWNAAPEVQALAWPLWGCALGSPQGCWEECKAGADGCRACAAEKCGPLYDACLADTSGAPIEVETPSEEVQQCRDLFDCVLACPQ